MQTLQQLLDQGSAESLEARSSPPLVVGGYEIDPKLLGVRPTAQCDVAICRGSCCQDGVWLTRAQADAITANAAAIRPHIAARHGDESRWFGPIPWEDEQFPPAEWVAAATAETPDHPRGRCCIFWRTQDGYCGLQTAAVAAGRHKWAWKPLYCALYPIVDDRRSVPPKLIFDDDNAVYRRGSRCGMELGPAQPLFQTYAEEVATVIGEAGYRELCAARGETPRR